MLLIISLEKKSPNRREYDQKNLSIVRGSTKQDFALIKFCEALNRWIYIAKSLSNRIHQLLELLDMNKGMCLSGIFYFFLPLPAPAVPSLKIVQFSLLRKHMAVLDIQKRGNNNKHFLYEEFLIMIFAKTLISSDTFLLIILEQKQHLVKVQSGTKK